jgi:hypothetical protein
LRDIAFTLCSREAIICNVTDVAITTFASTAREYCVWAESGTSASPQHDAAMALRLLSELYAAVLLLPEGEGSEDDVNSNSADEWRRVYDRFADLPVSNYWEIFNPLERQAGEPVLASLADDLADIHRDLQRGFVLFDRGDVNGAVWEWSFHFRAHWGHHLTAALYALHAWWAENYFQPFGEHPQPRSD